MIQGAFENVYAYLAHANMALTSSWVKSGASTAERS